MSFLSALYLIGTAAIVAPIMIHMIRRAPKDNFQFSTLRFLSSTPETVSKRSKIQHWLLLLLRALAIILIALAFARPYFVSEDMAGDKEKKAVVMFMVDMSASMNREGVREKLDAKLKERLSQLKITDDVAMCIFEKTNYEKVSFKVWKTWPREERKKQMLQHFKNFRFGWAESNMSVSFVQAADTIDRHLDEFGGKKADLEIFTDGQQGKGLDEVRSFSWPKRINVVVHNIEASQDNASISLVDINAENQQVKVKISNPEESKDLNLKVEMKTGEIVASTENISLVSGKNRFMVFDLKKLPSGTKQFSVEISGDKESYDNKVYCLIPKIAKKEIVWLGEKRTEAKDDSFYFNILCDSREDLELNFDGESLVKPNFKPSLLVVDRVITEEELKPIQSYMKNGGTVLFLLKSLEQKLSLEGLSGEKINVSEAQASDYFLLSEIRFDHWLFQPFIESKFKDFSTIYFWQSRQILLGEKSSFSVLAKLDEGIPAVLAKSFEKGEMIVMNSSWGKEDSQFALNSKFIPFINALVTASTRHSENLLHYSSGDPRIKTLTGNADSWRGLSPGFYDFDEGAEKRILAINLSPLESKMKLLENVDYESAGIPYVKQSILAEHEKSRYESEISSASTEVKNQGIWRYLLIAAVIILLMESFIAQSTHKKMEQAA